MYLIQGVPAGSAMKRCYTCLNDSGQFVQMDVFIEAEGILSICEKCIGKAAGLLDFIRPEAKFALEVNIESLVSQLLHAHEKSRDLESVIRNMEEFSAACSKLFPPSLPSPEPAPASLPVSEPSASPSEPVSVKPRETRKPYSTASRPTR